MRRCIRFYMDFYTIYVYILLEYCYFTLTCSTKPRALRGVKRGRRRETEVSQHFDPLVNPLQILPYPAGSGTPGLGTRREVFTFDGS